MCIRKWHDKEANNDNSNTAENSARKKKNPIAQQSMCVCMIWACVFVYMYISVHREAIQTF